MNWKHSLYGVAFALALISNPLVAGAAVTPDAPTNFITTWNTQNEGTSANNQITIPGAGTGYSYELYWEDTTNPSVNGTTTLITTNSYTLTFPAPGIYEVQASGTIPRIYFYNRGDKAKILTVEQWGNIAWTSMEFAFEGASNLRVPAIDAPDLSGVTSMVGMFWGSESFNDPIEHWNVSNVTDMAGMFQGAIAFNQPLNEWDTINVTDMSNMFSSATAFNQPLNEWDVSQVQITAGMFLSATAFNQPLNEWDVSKVEYMSLMFSTASAFNQPLNEWDTSSVIDMSGMFANLGFLFNALIDTETDEGIFGNTRLPETTAFNQPLNDWDVSKVTNMSNMFTDATAFNQPLNDWDTSQVTIFGTCVDEEEFGIAPTAAILGINLGLFGPAFNQSLASWDVSQATCMTDVLFGTALSTQNQDATLDSWSKQPVQPNLDFHLGTKSYSDVGALALQTLRTTHGWTITEQYRAEYFPSANAALFGDNVQTGLSPGDTTTQVRLTPQRNCTFVQWSDGNTQNPRTDTIGTDNLRVTAELSCPSNTQTSTSARTQRDRSLAAGNLENAERVEERFLDGTTPYQAPATLEDSLDEVRAIPELFANLDPVRDAETINVLIELLLEMIKVLMQLLVVQEEGVVE